MPREVDILSYLPPVLHEIKELVEIANVENKLLVSTWQAIEDSFNNRFIMSATEEGLARRERMLKIIVPATDSIETRRFRLLTRYQEQAPYTYLVLKQLLDSLLGEGQYVINRDAANKTLSVKIELTVKGQFDAVLSMLERITPQNMVLKVELRYNQNSLLEALAHSQLAGFTHEQLRSEVV